MTLQEYLLIKSMSQREFAKKIGVSESYMSLLINCERRPSPQLALAIEKATEGKVNRIEMLYRG